MLKNSLKKLRESNGLTQKEVAEKLKGTTCRSKDTSCPDQLAKAIAESL